jgi:hypothetical protein
VKTSADAFRLCKEEKWKLRVKGPVEGKFLFSTAVSDDILPFFIRALRLTVLPVLLREGQMIMMQSDEILAEGYPATSDWVARAEKIFSRNTKDSTMTAQGYLNFQNKLTAQRADAPYVVLYNKSGTNICAAYLNGDQFKEVDDLIVQGFVAESVTYRIYVGSEDEAHYLSGILNSTVVNQRIKPYQTEGVFHGKRDIHRRPFEVCAIPEFDKGNLRHMAIATCARQAKLMVQEWGPKMVGGLAYVREACRTLVAAQIREIDEHATHLLGLGKPHRGKAIKEDTSLQGKMF